MTAMDELPRTIKRLGNRLILIVIVSVFVAFISSSAHMSDLERVHARGQLVMLTIPGATTYFEDGHGKNGFDYLIAKAFADSLNVKLVVKPQSTLRRLLLSVGGPQGDFAAANIVATEARAKSLKFSQPFFEVTQQLIYRRGSKRPKSLDQLEGDLVVITGSSHSEQLKKLRASVPNLSWSERDDLEMSDLIRMVHAGEIPYTVVDSLAYLVNRHIYPRARKAFDIAQPQTTAWAFASHSDDSLLNAANAFIDSYISSGKLAYLEQQLFAYIENFSVGDSQRLGQLVARRLPKYEQMFRATAQRFDMDWALLAAVAYQESHWNPKARSPTGVRGLMMLTMDTAREMNVSNRLDAGQSLEGGAAYLVKLKARLPKRIAEPDRTLFSLAAYNVGFGHLEDARVLTSRSGKNPDLWVDVRAHLPLLSKKQFYSTVKHGYARGNEPVLYVDNIQYYRTYLQLHSLSQHNFEPPPDSPDLDTDTPASL
ncbi:membrane-bound lytic murein transglycosylase MltF [SAR92 clade bacterium H921]|nr:membrane-bound lytic murein transglycosylase MltF [SAR92 clade bacterium H921]